jgi:hypothetical protein
MKTTNNIPHIAVIKSIARQKAELHSAIRRDIGKLKSVLANIEAGRFQPGDLEMIKLAAAGCALNAESYAHLAK